MRHAVAIACGLLMALSSARFAQAQSATPPEGQPVAQQPMGASSVNYQNGLEALGQAPPTDQNSIVPGIANNDLLLGLGLAAAGGVAAAVISNNQNNNNNNPSVSP